jgi:DNA-binding CsgD family transcriptional regulator
MNMTSLLRPNREAALAGLILLQTVCAVLFVIDVIDDFNEMSPGPAFSMHIAVEVAANVGLILAILVEVLFLRRLLRQQARTERALSAASGALNQLMQDYFQTWGLTQAEADVAGFTIKGFSISEIAGMRQSAEGTVKSQLNAIYRKSGLAGRGQLVSLLIEDLLSGPLPVGGERVRAQSVSGLD